MVKEIVRCDTLEKRLITGLFLLFIFGLGLYGYFVVETALNIASRTALEREITSLSSEVGDLALTYMGTSNNITLEYASTLGFGEIESVSYVSRDQLVLTRSDDR